MVDVATAHALEYHRDFAPDEATFRTAIRAEIRSLMTQAHMTASEIEQF